MSASMMNVHCQVILSKPLSTSREWKILASDTTSPLEKLPEPSHPCDDWDGGPLYWHISRFSCLCAKPLILTGLHSSTTPRRVELKSLFVHKNRSGHSDLQYGMQKLRNKIFQVFDGVPIFLAPREGEEGSV